MAEVDLYHRLCDARLRVWCRIGGLVLAASLLLPYEVIDERPQFLWRLWGELPPAAALAGVAPGAGGLLLAAAAAWGIRRGASLGALVVGVLVALAGLDRLGQDAAAWGMLPLPASFSGRAPLAVIALAATAAGANLSSRPATTLASRVARVGGVVAAAGFYLAPGRGPAPAVILVRNFAALPEVPGLTFQVGLVTIGVVAAWPALMSVVGLVVRWRRPAPRPNATLGMLSVFGFPLLLMMLLFSWYVRSSPGAAVFGAIGEAIRLTAVLGLWAAALEVLLARALGDAPSDEPPGWPLSRAAGGVGLAVAALLGLGAWLARPPDKGLRAWTLGPATAEGDALFGDLVVAWSDERSAWEARQRRDESSALAFVAVKSRARDMTQAARALDPEVGTALGELARAAHRTETTTRVWYRRVAAVNAATRDAALPYYLDPRVSVSRTGEGIRRRLLLDSYRVERVRRFAVDDDPFAVLHVRSFGARRAGHRLGRLGFSRDQQPFALVVTAETEQHFVELQDFVRTDPPSCGLAFDAARDRAMRACGAMVKRTLDADFEGARATVIAKIERHELQHQIDGPLLTVADPVQRKLVGYADETVERVNRELSAFVAQCTLAAGAPKLALVIPLRFALLQDRGVYHHAAVLLFEALAGSALRRHRHRVDPERFAAAFDELMAADDEALRARARRAHRELFGDELPVIVALDPPAASRRPE
ncbi:MAG: hypothetical protein AAF928_08125 [Myxococcota bacterium]